jgi:LysR family transcriptional activator of nhaA
MSTLPWLNYHHLLYFHATARDGSMSAAAKKLRLAQPTLSGQIKQLEESLGEPLFERRGKRLELTPMGRTVYQYADEIFGLGQELLHAVRGKPAGRALRFSVGVSDALPKLVIYRLLEPVLALEGGARLDLRDGDLPSLLAELGAHRLDLVLTDAPLAADGGIRAYSHSLGESSVTFFGTPSLAAALRPGFPGSLDRAHMLLPGRAIALRRSLDEWMDRALLKAFGHRGVGVFAAPTIVAREVTEQFGVEPIGVAEEVVERFWAISAERRIRHPALGAVVAGARTLFAGAVR